MSTGNCRCTVARAFVGPNLRRAGFEANDAGIRIRVRETVSGVPVLRRPILFRMVCVRPSYSEESGPFLPRDRDRIDSHISGLVFLNRVYAWSTSSGMTIFLVLSICMSAKPALRISVR